MLTIVVTISLAFIGYIATYLNNIAVARRKDRLERINLQLRNLYGPLYATDQASMIAWDAFRSRYRPGGSFFSSTSPPTKEELEAWRLWMSEVFMPLNLRMEKIIVENADLILGDQIPDSFLQFIAHVVAYKPVIKKWQTGDYSEHTSFSNYPTEIHQHIVSSYIHLKEEQEIILGKLKRSSDA
jgi:hypothetical protein